MGLGFFIAKILLEQTGGMVRSSIPIRRRARHHGVAARRDRRRRPARTGEG